MLCACGCGREIPDKFRWNNPIPKYIHGHNRSGAQGWSKGLTKDTCPSLRMSEEAKMKISLASKGKPKSEAHKKALSIARKNSPLARETTKKNLEKMKAYLKTDEGKLKCSEVRKGRPPWNIGLTKETDDRVRKYGEKRKGYVCSEETRQKMIKAGQARKGRPDLLPKHGGRGKGGFREDIGHYVRSRWEANFARYLNYMGMPYEYEPKTFSLSDTLTYTPDFRIHHHGIDIYIELKGWMSDKCKQKIDTFRIVCPNEHLLVVGADKYKALAKVYEPIIPNWESKS